MIGSVSGLVRHCGDTLLLTAALVLVVAAALRPALELQSDIHCYFLVVDITQSMNVVDSPADGQLISRMTFTKRLLHNIIASLPCNTRVAIGLSAGSSVAALYSPIKVCANYAVINDTIDHLDWRSAWTANSRIRESMVSLASLLHTFPEPAQVVYFTDGEEAPALHAFNTRDLTHFQGGDGWLLVGIGSSRGTPIPKFDENNQLLGYWAADSFAVQPGISQISEGNLGVRDTSVAAVTTDRYLSRLHEDYLKALAKEVNGRYLRGDNLQAVLTAMREQKPLRRGSTSFGLDWLLASLAGLLLLSTYLSRRSG